MQLAHPISHSLAAAALAIALVGCQSTSPGTSVLVTLNYDASLGLDGVEVTIGDHKQAGSITHQLLLLVDEVTYTSPVLVSVSGQKRGAPSAYGEAMVTPQLGKTVDASVTLSACTPACANSQLTSCTTPVATCVLGCAADNSARCIVPQPSNGVDPTLASGVHGSIEIGGNAIFNTDTGAISGAISRPPGNGVSAGIGYATVSAMGGTGVALGVFAFDDLIIDETATITFTGKNAAVFLVADTAKIEGTIDASAGHGAQLTPGPGGGIGDSDGVRTAGGCSPGRTGISVTTDDVGGGGGAGGGPGGTGGGGGAESDPSGSDPCLSTTLEPLQGGSGGGRGGHGSAATSASGGGGGGAIQISALGGLTISGRILAGGAGGGGGNVAVTGNSGAGGGGGAGGAILLESPLVSLASSTILEANGGGGGGGAGVDGAMLQPVAGMAGQNALPSLTIATGGSGGGVDNAGGTGGVDGSPADTGQSAPNGSDANGGGGGGGTGAIVIRTHGPAVMLDGLITPRAVVLDIHQAQ